MPYNTLITYKDIMTEPTLSPAAQAVLDAFNGVHELVNRRRKIAATLRAVANDWRIDTESIGGVEYIRISTLDKIADELEGI
jgi:hypothetical protein